MGFWQKLSENLMKFFQEKLPNEYLALLFQVILLTALFYFMFKILKNNRGFKFIIIVMLFIVFAGLTFAMSNFDSQLLLILIIMVALLVFTMFHTEIKRNLIDSAVRKGKNQSLTTSGIELVIDEIIRAVQNMSKKDIGALIVLSDDNLPDGIIESGTVINAQITSEMIEAVFYPKAPLHDGAMIITSDKIYAAGCFLPLPQNENLPKDMGSRHRAALGVTTVASVTAIVVSEETGIISIAKNGVIKKKYADATDIKNALVEFYWSDLTAED